MLKVKEDEIKSLVQDLYTESEKQEFHRYKSMIYCFKFFQNNVIGKNPNEKTLDLAALNLAMYLASWGMYRGSSFLLRCNYKVFINLIKDICKYKFDPYNLENNDSKQIVECFKEIEKYLKEKKLEYSKREKPTEKIGTTLITKIMLGVFGITPAFDKYFILGLAKHKELDFVKNWFNKTDKFELAYNKLMDFYKNNEAIITNLSETMTTDDCKIPPMRVIDIYFWKLGKEEEIE